MPHATPFQEPLSWSTAGSHPLVHANKFSYHSLSHSPLDDKCALYLSQLFDGENRSLETLRFADCGFSQPAIDVLESAMQGEVKKKPSMR